MTASIDAELWLLERMRAHCIPIGDPFDGVTEPHERRQRFRDALQGYEAINCGTRAGKSVTYAEAFERLYAEKL